MTSNTNKGTTSLFTLLLVLFIGLKLGGVIDWSWWWVLAPFWGPPALVVLLAIPIFFIKLAESRK